MANMKEMIQSEIVAFWEDVALSEASLPDNAPKFPDTLDSHSAVDILIGLEKIVGFELEAYKVIRRGGYDSKDQFVEHLTAKVLECVEERAGVKK